MNEDQKRLFDAYDKLREAAWASFDRRSKYEWQMCLSFWGAILALTALAIEGKTAKPLLPSTTAILAGLLWVPSFSSQLCFKKRTG